MQLKIPQINFSSRALAEFVHRHRVALARAIRGGDFRVHNGELLMAGDLLRGQGTYFHAVFDRFMQQVKGERGELQFDHNLLTDEGIAANLDILLFTLAKISNWYLGLFNGSTAPTNTTAGSNVASTLAEITSTVEGYTQANRVAYVGAASAGGISSNIASMAQFTIATASSINVVGGFAISDNTRGGTAGKCLSAAQFGATRTLFNAETFGLGYQLQLTN